MVQITAFTGWYFTVSHFISSSNYQHKIDALDNMEATEISTLLQSSMKHLQIQTCASKSAFKYIKTNWFFKNILNHMKNNYLFRLGWNSI